MMTPERLGLVGRLRRILELPPEVRRARARKLDEDLDPYMTALGVLFLLIVLAERGVPEGTPVGMAFEIVSYVIAAAFIGDFVLRLIIEPDTKKFLLRNAWQIPFLVFPMLRFLRLIRLFRIGRPGRLMPSVMHSSRSATHNLANRVLWLLTIHAIVVLSVANVVSDRLGASYSRALHLAALAATKGDALPGAGVMDALEVGLALYSVGFFAAMAGSVGSFYFERRENARGSALTTGADRP